MGNLKNNEATSFEEMEEAQATEQPTTVQDPGTVVEKTEATE
jgi:hypothetical protein